MVNFRCCLDWLWGAPIKHDPPCVCDGVTGLSDLDCPPDVLGTIGFTEGRDRRKRGGSRNSPLFPPPPCLSRDISPRLPALTLGLPPSAPLDSQTFGFGLNYTTGSLGSGLQMADHGASQPPESHDPAPQNKSLLCPSTSMCLSISISNLYLPSISYLFSVSGPL